MNVVCEGNSSGWMSSEKRVPIRRIAVIELFRVTEEGEGEEEEEGCE